MNSKPMKFVALVFVILSLLVLVEVPQQAIAPSPSLQATIASEQPFYAPGELVRMIGNTTDTAGTPVSSVSVALEVRDPNSGTVFLDITTSYSNGSFCDSFRLSVAAANGTYTIYAVASKAGYNSISNQTTFSVGSSNGLAFAVWTRKSSYMRFENATVSGRLLYNRNPVQNATVTFNIIFPNGTTWLTLTNTTTTTGITARDFYLSPTVPSGQYRINGTAYDELHGNATAISTFTIQNQEPTIFSATVNPQIIEKPNTASMLVNASDFEDYMNLTIFCVITLSNGTVQLLNMSLTGSLFELQYYVPTAFPSGTYSVTFKAVDKDAGSSDYQKTFEVVTPVTKGGAAGFVVNTAGLGIDNATVILSLRTAYLTYTGATDSQGYYSFTSVLPGEYSLIISAEDYSSSTINVIIEGGQTSNQNTTLLRLPVLTGYITTVSGQPISNASVIVVGGSGTAGRGYTAVNGSYSLVLSLTGMLTVIASAPQFSPNQTSMMCLLEQVAILNLSLVKNGALVGHLLDAVNGTAIVNATAIVFNALVSNTCKTNSTGYFQYGSLTPGSYGLILTGDNYVPNSTSVTIYANQTTILEITLVPTGNVTGTIRDCETNGVIQNARVSLLDDRDVTLATVLTDSNGRYLFYLVPPGNYTLKVHAYGYNTTSAYISPIPHSCLTVNFTLNPSVIFLSLELSSPQFSQGETARFTIVANNAQNQSIADNITDISITMKGPDNETRTTTATRQGSGFIASYIILSNETIGLWTVTVHVKDSLGVEAEAMQAILIREAFLLDFFTDKSAYVQTEKVNFTAYVLRYSNLTRFLNSDEVAASVRVFDLQNVSIANLSLVGATNCFYGEFDLLGLAKGEYIACLNVTDANGDSAATSLSFSIVQEFRVIVQTDKTQYNRTAIVHITGSLAFTNGTAVTNTNVVMSLIVKNCQRLYSVATNETGFFELPFTPFGVAYGNYSLVCYSTVDGITRNATTYFTIYGLEIDPSNAGIRMPENTNYDLTVKLTNDGEASLTGISLSMFPLSAGGVSVSILNFSQNMLSPGTWTTFVIRISVAAGATPQVTFNLTVATDQGAVEYGMLDIYAYPALPAVEVTPQVIDLSMAPAEYVTATITVKNIGYGTLQGVSMTRPSTNWITLACTSLGSIPPQDSKSFDLMINPPNNTNIELYQDQIQITSTNYQTTYVYLIVKVTSAQNGSLVFHITDDVGAQLQGARVTLQYQEFWQQVYTKVSNSTGYCEFANIFGGRYSYSVSAENHQTGTGTLTVQPDGTICQEVMLPSQLMDIKFTVTPTTIQETGQIQLTMTFETAIPPPLIIPVPINLQYRLDRAVVYKDGCDTTIDLTLVNSGLVSISQISLDIESGFPSGYDLSLGGHGHQMLIPEIEAQQSAKVPCRLTIDRQTNISALSKGLVNKISIEGYYTYFDNNSIPQTMKVTAEVAVQVVDIGFRMLRVEPWCIWAVNLKDHLEISSDSSSEELPAVTITNCAQDEAVFLLTKVGGGGVDASVDLSLTGVEVSTGLFLALGNIKKMNQPIPETDNPLGSTWINCTAIEDQFDSILVSMLVYELQGNPWIRLEVGQSAFINAKNWEIPTNPKAIKSELTKIWNVAWGPSDESSDLEGWLTKAINLISFRAGAIAFQYKWEYDDGGSYWIIPIFMLNIKLGNILDLLPGGPPDLGIHLNFGYSKDADVKPPEQQKITDPFFHPPTYTGSSPPNYYYKIEYENVTTVREIVKLSISQEATLERDAFSATLQMTNRMPTESISNVRVELNIASPNGTNARYNFYVGAGDLQGISAIDGTGIIQPAATATVCWLIIPKPGAGGTNPDGIDYTVQATIFYMVNQTVFNISSTAQPIRVKPQPLIRLDYYLPREVFANIPFKLAVRVTNVGYGVAHNFKIDSAQPVIYENLAHLLINFQLTGSYVHGISCSNSFRLDFGEIPPGETIVGYWTMVTSLAGNFTAFNATFVHENALGGEDTSLIQTPINTYILMRDVMIDDIDFAFLAGSALDNKPIQVVDPATGVAQPVVEETPEKVCENSTSLTIRTQKASQEWIWVEVDDPFNGTKPIKQITRSDGKVLNVKNYWTANNRIYLLDDPDENYTIFFGIEDIGVHDAVLAKAVVGQGYKFSANVTVCNYGDYNETFNLTIYADATILNQTQIALMNGTITNVVLAFTTSNLTKGNHIIQAVLDTLPDETNTTNNVLIVGTLYVGIPGDVNADGQVDVKDVYKVAKNYGTVRPPDIPPWDSVWGPVCDINGDNKVDIKDYYIVCKHYGEVDP